MRTLLSTVAAVSIGFSSFALANVFNTQDLIKNRIQTALRVQQIESAVDQLNEQIEKLSDEKKRLERPTQLKAEEFLSILSQRNGQMIGKCQINVSTADELVTLEIKVVGGLSVNSTYTLKNLNKGTYRAEGRIGTNKRLMILQAKDMYDTVNDKETKIIMVVDENNQVQSFRATVALKGKNFDTKDCM